MPTCEIQGIEDILSSMFETFKVTFGHGEFDAYHISTPVMLTYSLFVIISGLLFMNLIIAIMSTTATEVMTNPWKDTLWRIEWLEEALSVEFTFSVLSLPFSRCCHCDFKSHKWAGYDVTHSDRKGRKIYTISIEVFHCPALD